MFPLRMTFTLDLKIGQDEFKIKYLEATAEEGFHFCNKVKSPEDLIERLLGFIKGLDSLKEKEKEKIIKSIHREPKVVPNKICEIVTSTMFRPYISRYKDVKKWPTPDMPKHSKQKYIMPVTCDASVELSLSKATGIPVHQINKELTTYQRGWLKDGLICDTLNTFDKGKELNKVIWRDLSKVNKDGKTKEWLEEKKRMDAIRDQIAILDRKKV